MADFGWNEYINKTGTPCGWCDKPSTHTLVLEPDEYKAQELVRRGKRVGVCDEHNRPAEELPPALNFRRRKAKDVEQLKIDTDTTTLDGTVYGKDAA